MTGLLRAVRDAWSRRHLASCTQVGQRARVDGAPHIRVLGRLTIGDDFELRSRPVQSHLVVGEGAELRIGNGVQFAMGAAVSCQGKIEIADNVRFGAFCMIMDSDFHVAGDSEIAPEPKPIRIGANARLGHRVVVLPGSTIGAGAVVAAGSVVSGDVPPGACVAGNPARVGVAGDESADGRGVAQVIKTVLGLAELPAAEDGPSQIHEWDSLGALRLVLALEERFEITLTEDEIRTAHSVGDVEAAVSAARRRRAAVG